MKSPPSSLLRMTMAGGGGERGIRTPGSVKNNGFQDRRIKPLCHLSNEGAKIVFFCNCVSSQSNFMFMV